MEALKRITRRKKKDPEEVKELEVPPPEPMAPSMEDVRPQPAPLVLAEKQEQHYEQQQEMVAMNTFRQRISSYRHSQAGYRNNMAPGFDYAHWKPYGTVRYRDQNAEYMRLASNLAPYVRSVVESACLGVEERRWAAMTQQHPETLAMMESRAESRAASRQVSRAASRDRLAV